MDPKLSIFLTRILNAAATPNTNQKWFGSSDPGTKSLSLRSFESTYIRRLRRKRRSPIGLIKRSRRRGRGGSIWGSPLMTMILSFVCRRINIDAVFFSTHNTFMTSRSSFHLYGA
jgi:hypothetical protein